VAGETAEATILFTDIAGFTTIAEYLTPAELVGALNDYLETVLERHTLVAKVRLRRRAGCPIAARTAAARVASQASGHVEEANRPSPMRC